MDSYSHFATLYDEFMEDVPYDEWCDFIVRILKENQITDSLVCELGSGTGNITERMALKGYDMIGIDNSDEMLSVAQNKRTESDDERIKKILYLCQDMREFELYGTVSAFISSFDSINYLLEDGEVEETFRLVNNYLDPKGLFIFDFNTDANYRKLDEAAAGSDVIDDVTFTWCNTYDEDQRINEHELSFFVPSAEDSDLYRKYTEYHYQRGYKLEEIKDMLKKSGLVFEKAYDGYSFEEADEESSRIYVVARESGK